MVRKFILLFVFLLCHATAQIDLLKQTKSSCTTGRVFFAGSTGQVNCDGGIVWDNTNKRLGIGVSSPLDKLSVATGDWSSGMNSGIRLQTNGDEAGVRLVYKTDGTGIGRFAVDHWIPGDLREVFSVGFDGNVGIGTANSDAKLDVVTLDNTNLKFQGATGKLVVWPYYNFGGNLYGVWLTALNAAESAYGPMTFTANSFRFNLGRFIQAVPAGAPGDAELENGQATLWFDEGNNRLVFRCRTSGGVLKTGYLAVN